MKFVDRFTHPLPDFVGAYDGWWPGYKHLQVRTPEGRTDRHIGDDYNGPGGGNNDEGMKLVACAAGLVEAVIPWKGNYGFGNHLFIKHKLPAWLQDELVEKYGIIRTDFLYSHYAHMGHIIVKEGNEVDIGQEIGTVGKTGTKYAHIHFDLRRPTGRGYEDYPSFMPVSWIRQHYLTPFTFIEDHLEAPEQPPAPTPKPPEEPEPAPPPVEDPINDDPDPIDDEPTPTLPPDALPKPEIIVSTSEGNTENGDISQATTSSDRSEAVFPEGSSRVSPLIDDTKGGDSGMSDKNPTGEAVKEFGRLALLSLVSYLLTEGVIDTVITQLTGTYLDMELKTLLIGFVTYLLRAADKWLHERGKQEGREGYLGLKGLTGF